MENDPTSTPNLISGILSNTLKPSPEEVLFNLRCLLVFALTYISFISTKLLVRLVRFLSGIFDPMNYELDMTTEKYCKNLASVDNTLKFQTMRQRTVTQIETMRSVDCTAELADSSDPVKRLTADALNTNSNGDNAKLTAHESYSSAGADQNDYVYPNGWLPVMESSKVKPGEIKRAIIMGQDVIVTRSLEGLVSILDAYCPHMGVNIGVGGKVLRVNGESCVQCPFHGWTFRATDGLCVRIPYAENDQKCSNIPKQAKLNTWVCDEVNNFIFTWYHIDNQLPTWRIEQIPELNDKNWLLIGRSCHKTNLDLRDMLENGADMNHFEGIHNDLFVFGGEYLKVQNFSWLQRYARHHWAPNWEPIVDDDGKTTHKAQLSLCSWISLFNMRLFDISIRATQIGPAYVALKFHSKWYGRGMINMFSIPLGGRRTLYVQHIYTTNNYFDRFMAKWVLFGEIKQLERDLFMWNHKRTITSPIFVPEDKIIKRFRLWYSQFYKRKRKVIISVDGNKPGIGTVPCVNDNIEF